MDISNDTLTLDSKSNKPNSSKQTIEQSSGIRALLEKTNVNLPEGVSKSDLGITIDGRIQMLEQRLSQKTGKYVYGDEEIITPDSLVRILNEQIAKMDIPNLLDPTEDDIEKI